MPFQKGHKKFGGRKKGGLSKDRLMLMEKAERLGIDPLEILLHIANGDWKTLGYDSPGSVRRDKYCEWLELTISTETRAKAAADAAQFMLPKLKAEDFKVSIGEGGGPMVLTLNVGGNAGSHCEPDGVDSAPGKTRKVD